MVTFRFTLTTAQATELVYQVAGARNVAIGKANYYSGPQVDRADSTYPQERAQAETMLKVIRELYDACKSLPTYRGRRQLLSDTHTVELSAQDVTSIETILRRARRGRNVTKSFRTSEGSVAMVLDQILALLPKVDSNNLITLDFRSRYARRKVQ